MLSRALADANIRTGLQYEYSDSRYSIAQYPGMTALVTYINFHSLADCEAYIDKIASFGSTYAPGQVEISASAGGYRQQPLVF